MRALRHRPQDDRGESGVWASESNKSRSNLICFDCKKKSTYWATVTYGVFICFECSGKHRHLSVNSSFVRSCDLDEWTPVQLKAMELGGNKRARIFFQEHGYTEDGVCDHRAKYSSRAAVLYRKHLETLLEDARKQDPTYAEAFDPNASPAQSDEPEDFFAKYEKKLSPAASPDSRAPSSPPPISRVVSPPSASPSASSSPAPPHSAPASAPPAAAAFVPEFLFAPSEPSAPPSASASAISASLLTTAAPPAPRPRDRMIPKSASAVSSASRTPAAVPSATPSPAAAEAAEAARRAHIESVVAALHDNPLPTGVTSAKYAGLGSDGSSSEVAGAGGWGAGAAAGGGALRSSGEIAKVGAEKATEVAQFMLEKGKEGWQGVKFLGQKIFQLGTQIYQDYRPGVGPAAPPQRELPPSLYGPGRNPTDGDNNHLDLSLT
ncbi:putative adp-ribosylation factor gtpase-activating protein agd8 [Paratrimastix pyriformis]|uniref:Adp-ribosylation factor gtpase-activating protein agd8 n=1 Tax=Paratrimastix pyriformis TaxID=342808 RepID=A0ABQ8U608_9EUKA|nr:putative adp-ribosylation factor gtpase-activating protein agd8 [Paratrimastix pyriformis]